MLGFVIAILCLFFIALLCYGAFRRENTTQETPQEIAQSLPE